MARLAYKLVGGGLLATLAVMAVVVAGASGAASSGPSAEAATLTTTTVHTCPTATLGITQQPVSQTVTAGQTATFSANAYQVLCTVGVQWFVSTDHGATFTAVPGASLDTLMIPDTTTAQSGYEYYALFSSDIATARSNTVTLTVLPATPPPPAPTVTKVFPPSGPTAGGVAIVSGTGFGHASGVAFGGVSARYFLVVSSHYLITLVPPHAAGVADVTVTGPGGASAVSSGDQYTYVG